MTLARVVFITDPSHGIERTAEVVRAAATALNRNAGRLLVQLRDKQSTEAALQSAAEALRVVTHEVGALLVVNGSPAIAERSGADGVHYPSSSGAGELHRARQRQGAHAFLSMPAHDDDDVRRALAEGATAVLVSPIFATPGKGPPRGLDAISRARAIVDAARQSPPLLVYALGGVTPANAASCAQAGADGVAAIRALYDDAAAAGPLGAPFLRGGRSGMG